MMHAILQEGVSKKMIEWFNVDNHIIIVPSQGVIQIVVVELREEIVGFLYQATHAIQKGTI